MHGTTSADHNVHCAHHYTEVETLAAEVLELLWVVA